MSELSLDGGSNLRLILQTSNERSTQTWAPMDTVTVPAAASMPQAALVPLSVDSTPNPLGRFVRWVSDFSAATAGQYSVIEMDLVGRE